MVLTGIVLSAAGSLMIALTPAGTSVFLMAGRIIQGLSAACIMPASLALIKAYYEGPARQRALSYLSMGSWGGSGLCSLFGGLWQAPSAGGIFSSFPSSYPRQPLPSYMAPLKAGWKGKTPHPLTGSAL